MVGAQMRNLLSNVLCYSGKIRDRAALSNDFTTHGFLLISECESVEGCHIRHAQ